MSRGFVAYLQVPGGRKKRQPDLNAQRAATAKFIVDQEGDLLAEYVESRREPGRPELERALDLCHRTGATLAVPDLTGLARAVVFLTRVLESAVEFVALDIPCADHRALQVLAAIAEREREETSRRIATALADARARGAKLGNPNAAEAAAQGRAALEARAAPARRVALPQALALHAAGLSLRRIAATLNARGIPTPRGGCWHATTVATLLREDKAKQAVVTTSTGLS